MRDLLDPAVAPPRSRGWIFIHDADGALPRIQRSRCCNPLQSHVRDRRPRSRGTQFGAGGHGRGWLAQRLRRRPRRGDPRHRGSHHAAEPVATILSMHAEAGPTTSTSSSAANWRCSRDAGPALARAPAGSTPRSGASNCSSTSSTARLDETTTTDRGRSLHPLGALLEPALQSGRLRSSTPIEHGLADDELAHAYVEEIVHFLPRPEPALRSSTTTTYKKPEARDEVMSRLDELVIKPRDGFGDHGVTIMPRATRATGGR